MESSSGRSYEFGGFRLYPLKRLLMLDGLPIAVRPKVWDTLRILVANSGRVVSKGELISQIWAGATVDEGGLTRDVSDLRKILDTDGSGDRFIATLPGRGYQFVADVHEVTEPRPSRVWSCSRTSTIGLLKASRPGTSRTLAPFSQSCLLQPDPSTRYSG